MKFYFRMIKQIVKKYGLKYLFAVVITDWGTWSVCSYSIYHGLAWLKWHPLNWLKSFTFESDEAFSDQKEKYTNYITRKIEWIEKQCGLKNSPQLVEAVLLGLVTRMGLPPAPIKIGVIAPFLASLRMSFYLPVILSSYFITFYLAYDIFSRHKDIETP